MPDGSGIYKGRKRPGENSRVERKEKVEEEKRTNQRVVEFSEEKCTWILSKVGCKLLMFLPNSARFQSSTTSLQRHIGPNSYFMLKLGLDYWANCIVLLE